MAHTLPTNGRIILAPGRTYDLEAVISRNGVNSLDYFEWRNANTNQTLPGALGQLENDTSYPTYDQQNTARAIYTPTTTTEVYVYRGSANSSLSVDWQGNGSYIIVKQMSVIGTALAAGGATGTLQFNMGGAMAAADWLRVSTSTGSQALIISNNQNITSASIGGSLYTDLGITLGSSTPTTTANTLYAVGADLYWNGGRFQLATSSAQGVVLDYFYGKPFNMVETNNDYSGATFATGAYGSINVYSPGVVLRYVYLEVEYYSQGCCYKYAL
jgi:hypothetical protein